MSSLTMYVDAMTTLQFERYAARESIVGTNTRIHRALPNARRRSVGAWCFLDHVGPVNFEPGQGLHVGPHPHIGLQTFTWMIEGEIMHRDSLGNEQIIYPGQVNLMTSGNGVCHTEDSIRDGTPMHAAQLWIALPESRRHGPADFANYADIPEFTANGVTVKVLAGELAGHRSPAEIYSPLIGADFSSTDDAGAIGIDLQPGFEYGFMLLYGLAEIGNESVQTGELLYLAPGAEALQIRLDANSRLLMVGGEPIDPPLIWWNFVAKTQDELMQAIQDWNERTSRFPPPVPGSNAPELKAPAIESIRIKTAHDAS